MMEAALASSPYLAGADWSLADAAATPYIWRLDKLKLAPLWNRRPASPPGTIGSAGGRRSSRGRRLGQRGRS